MGGESNIPEVVRAAIEEAAADVRQVAMLANRFAPTRERLSEVITECLTPTITVLIAEVRRQDAEAVCKRQCGDDAGEVAHDDDMGFWFHPKDGWPSVLCPAGPIHDLRKADEKT
ncbi:hypothetical protein LCGC14_3133780 [marine sediment metagenome]|uniref:Uncharacterized protein n=1 Tax=marine sediment metagenome TaxID=412755 RepID=A0A0F8VYW9_9ZZZZ